MTEKIREGDVYKVFSVGGVTFKICYGYHSPEEKKREWEPTPIYPDFTETKQYTLEGYPFASVYQDICEHYKPKKNAQAEEWCENCQHFEKGETYIGICRCKKRHRDVMKE